MSHLYPAPPKALIRLSAYGIDGTVATTYECFTTAGSIFIPTQVVLILADVASFAAAATVKVGVGGDNSILQASALANLVEPNDMMIFTLGAVRIWTLAGATAVQLTVTTQAAASTYLLDVHLIGVYL